MLTTIISAVFAALVSILATISIEKFGGKLGGVISSAPSTIVPASLGFWFSAESISDFQASQMTVSLGMFVNALFLYSWRIVPSLFSKESSLGFRLGGMILISMSVWAIGALGLVFLLDWISDLHLWGIGGGISLVLFGIVACLRNPPAPKGTRKISWLVLMSRGVLAGLAIGFAVWLSSLGSPILAGMASIFPAIFMTTMVSVWLSQGSAVQGGAVGPMMLGASSVSFFAIISAYLYPEIPLVLAVLLSWFGSVLLISVPAWLFLQKLDS
jgi:hypothetical protein